MAMVLTGLPIGVTPLGIQSPTVAQSLLRYPEDAGNNQEGCRNYEYGADCSLHDFPLHETTLRAYKLLLFQ